MAFEILDRNTVKHRNGTTTEWVKYRVPTDAVVLQFAIFSGVVSQGAILFPRNMTWKLVQERHGSRTYTYVRVYREVNGMDHLLCSATKSQIGNMFNVQFSQMESDYSVYWEADRPDTTFAVDGMRAPSIERVVKGIFDRYELNGGTITKPFAITDKDLQSIQRSAIEHDEFDLAAAIDHRNQLETYSALKAYLDGCTMPALAGMCCVMRFYPEMPEPL